MAIIYGGVRILFLWFVFLLRRSVKRVNRVFEKRWLKMHFEKKKSQYSIFLCNFHWFVLNFIVSIFLVCLGMLFRSLLNYECVMLVAHTHTLHRWENIQPTPPPPPKNDMHERIDCVLGIVTNTSAFFFLLVRCNSEAFWTRCECIAHV